MRLSSFYMIDDGMIMIIKSFAICAQFAADFYRGKIDETGIEVMALM